MATLTLTINRQMLEMSKGKLERIGMLMMAADLKTLIFIGDKERLPQVRDSDRVVITSENFADARVNYESIMRGVKKFYQTEEEIPEDIKGTATRYRYILWLKNS